MAKRRVTRADVAKRAGVSTAVVSYVVNNGPRPVAVDTRRRVEKAIKELGYFPNEIARSLRNQQSFTIGVVVQNITDPTQALIASNIQELCSDKQYLVLLCNSEGDPAKEERYIEMLRNKQVEGIVIIPTQESPALLRPLIFAGIPTVVIDKQIPHTHSILAYDLEAGRVGTEYLLSLGHRRIGFLTRIMDRVAPSERLIGYAQALASAVLAFDDALISPTPNSIAGAYVATRKLLSLPNPPTAIFTHNDLITTGALHAVKDAGLTVPGDISILGYATTPNAAYFFPPLTTLEFDIQYMSERIVETLFSHIEKDNLSSASTIMLPIKLVVRASTAERLNRVKSMH